MQDMLIHIGYSKTGTTWLQNEVFMDSSTIFSRLTLKDTHKGRLSFQFFLGKDKYLLSPFQDNTEEINKAYLKILNEKHNTENKVLVISNERLSGNYLSNGFDAKLIAHRLHQAFPHAKILICIREQKSHILSSYFQYLSRGGVLGLKKYLGINIQNHKVPGFSPHFFNFTPLIKEYYSLFGKNQVLVLPYELLKKTPSTYMKTIANFIGKVIPVEENQFKIQHNVKKDIYTLHYFRWLNQFRYSNTNNYYSIWKNRYTSKIANTLYRLFNLFISIKMNHRLKNKLSNFVYLWVGDRYIETNKELSELIGIDLSKYDYY